MGLGGLDLLCPDSSVVGIASSTKLDFGIRRLSWASKEEEEEELSHCGD